MDHNGLLAHQRVIGTVAVVELVYVFVHLPVLGSGRVFRRLCPSAALANRRGSAVQITNRKHCAAGMADQLPFGSDCTAMLAYNNHELTS